MPGDLRILKLLVNPLDENSVFLLSGKGRFACGSVRIYHSSDGGVHWSSIGTSLGEMLDVALDPQNPQILYLTTMNASCDSLYYWYNLDGTFYKSTDGGTNWAAMTNRTGVI